MNFFTKNTDAQKKFFEEFSKKVNDNIVMADMAEFRAEKIIYDELKITPSHTGNSLWGLAVFCEHGFYFYITPSENFFNAMVRSTAHYERASEQLVALHEIENLKAALPQGSFISKLSYEHSHRIDFSFTSKHGTALPFAMIFSKKTDIVFNMVKKYCTS